MTLSRGASMMVMVRVIDRIDFDDVALEGPQAPGMVALHAIRCDRQLMKLSFVPQVPPDHAQAQPHEPGADHRHGEPSFDGQ